MMDLGVGIAVSCYRDTFAKSLRDGLTQTIMSTNQTKTNFDFTQETVSVCIDVHRQVLRNLIYMFFKHFSGKSIFFAIKIVILDII